MTRWHPSEFAMSHLSSPEGFPSYGLYKSKNSNKSATCKTHKMTMDFWLLPLSEAPSLPRSTHLRTHTITPRRTTALSGQCIQPKAEKMAPAFTVCVLALVAPLPLEGSREVEKPNNLDQDHNRYADTDEDFHIVPLGCCRRCARFTGRGTCRAFRG